MDATKRGNRFGPKLTGITGRLLIWFFAFVLVFFTAVFVLYSNVNRMMRISETIVGERYRILSAAKKVQEHLLRMEENDRKFRLIPRDDYRDYFLAARAELERELAEILEIEGDAAGPWRDFRARFRETVPAPETIRAAELSGAPWIPESEIDAWIDAVSRERLRNEREIERANRELNRLGLWTVRAGLAGLVVAVAVGILGVLLLSHSMIRPLGVLLNGIRSISRDGPVRPVAIDASDEFGELAASFNEMAERLTEEQRMRSDFISTLSHEIRTPLTSIRESVNLVGEGLAGDVNEKQRRLLDIAGQEMARVSDLLNRIMHVSYLESGELTIERRPVPTGPFVADCLDRVRSAAETKGIALTADLAPDLPDLRGDEGYLRQVFANVLGNAVKFVPPGGRVAVAAAPENRGERVRFSISDDGPGIPESERSFVFNKYYRARATRNSTDGAGLGLSIARHIVEAHGGDIAVVGDPGAGTTIAFTLPTLGKAVRP